MTTDKGVWNLQQVRDKQLQSLWTYTGSATEGAQLWSWGQYPVGNNTASSYSSPVQIPGDWKKYYNSFIKFGIKEGDTLWAWGNNTYGSLGQNNRTTYSSPIQIPGTWSAVMVGQDKDFYKAGAITTDGELFCWGRQTSNIKFLDDVDYSSPVQIPGTTWKQGSWDKLAAYWTKTDGTMWALGSNMYGQLGNNGPTGGNNWAVKSKSSPIQIPGTSWSHVSGSLALRTDGTLWTWGANEKGQLGLNQTASYPGTQHKSSPTQIPGTWKSISHGDMNRMAVKTDGTLWMWGYNPYGVLGQNDTTWRSSPVQVGSDTTWEAVALFNYVAKAIKTDGTLWAWGWNGAGEAAQNNITNYSSPVQIPGTWLSNRLETSYGGAIRF